MIVPNMYQWYVYLGKIDSTQSSYCVTVILRNRNAAERIITSKRKPKGPRINQLKRGNHQYDTWITYTLPTYLCKTDVTHNGSWHSTDTFRVQI